jgi:hypothetical protein
MLSPLLFMPFILGLSTTVTSPCPASDKPAAAPAASAGFTEAVFDAATLNDIMSDRDCASVRFYNSMPDGSTTGTVMVIGVKADGSEITGGLFAQAYKASMGLADDRAIIDGQTKGGAGKACVNITAGGSASYSAAFAKADVQTLLGQAGCNGIRVTPDEANGSTTMRIEAVTIARSAASVIGAGAGFELVCGDPCPAFCGSPLSHYVNDELIPNK